MLNTSLLSLCTLMILWEGSFAQNSSSDIPAWNFYFQQTVIGQYHFDFPSAYADANSLAAHEGAAFSFTSTVFIGRRLWQGGELYCDPELAGGSGLSGSTGVAGALNGETYRIGDPAPSLAIARLYIRQSIALSEDRVAVPDAPNQIGGMQPTHRLSITLGKYSVADQFDNNSVSHDPRTQFLNWSLMSVGAWDYPADTKGYTIGATVEYSTPDVTVRAATDLVAKSANQSVFDKNLSQAHSETVELEIPESVLSGTGTIRILGFHTLAHMGNYLQAIQSDSGRVPDITSTRAYGRAKYGFGLNIDQTLGKYVTVFSRASWNDGRNETWMFTEIDRSFSAGCAFDGVFRKPGDDILRGAFVLNGISDDHRKYLEAGGSGFILGDGKLNYALESIVELQYLTRITSYFALSADYQFVLNPGYNKDRGPVHVVGLRGHVAM
ncbi:MAG: carbohydrate porin [Bacteroidota bacterium]|nr:carbohydrate porin [Bacteroidota bacterium]